MNDKFKIKEENTSIERILLTIHDITGFDFTHYKEGTIKRRLHSRLKKLNLDRYDEYVAILKKDESECVALINEFTINVTEFFRNPESFDAIEKIVVPNILKDKEGKRHRIIRVWSCGCSDGDEAFSVAMLFDKALGDKLNSEISLFVSGTDIDRGIIEAIEGKTYSENRLKGVDPEFIDIYFDRNENGEYLLKKKIKDMVKFKHHNVLSDKPIMHNDLILCRNLLIYFNKQLQEEILLKLYECLNPGGYLVIGMCETLVGSALKRYESVNNSLRIYRRPEKESLADNIKNGILSQEEIDRILKQVTGRED